MSSDKFPFIYIGQGKLNPTYIDKCEECYIWFKREVKEAEKKEIIKECPVPLSGFFNWAGEFLHFGSADDTYDYQIIKNYCDEKSARMIQKESSNFFSGEKYNRVFKESLDRFADELEKWMLKVNNIVPVAFFIGPNGSSGEAEWNSWSRENLREVAQKHILNFLETGKDIFRDTSGQDEISEINKAGIIQKNLSPLNTKRVLGYILRFIIRFPVKHSGITNENELSDNLKIVEALFATDELEHYIETLTFSDTRIKTNSNILDEILKEFQYDKQIEIIHSLAPYTQLAFYSSKYNCTRYLVNQKDPVEIVKSLLEKQSGSRKPALAGLLYFMANNMVKVGPAYGDENDFTDARLAAEILELSFGMEDVRAEAFINAAAFYDRLKDFDKMLQVSLIGNSKFKDNTTIITNIIYSAQNLGKKDIADRFVSMTENFTSNDAALLLNQTYNFITKGEYEKAREMVLNFINRGGIISPQIMNNILYTYIHGTADKYKEPFLLMTMNFAAQKNENPFKSNKEFICNATIVLNNDKRFRDSEKLLGIYRENGGEFSADIFNQLMYTALELKDKVKVKNAVSEFVTAFQSNAQIIEGHEYALHSAACCFGFLNDKANALEYVRLAEWNGYNNFADMKDDEYLKILANNPDFINMFK